MQKITTFLMFEGHAEEAMHFYMTLFPDAEIISIVRFSETEDGPQGKILHAAFALNGQVFMCIDSAAKHAFTFTPAMSLYVTCESAQEIDRLYAALSNGGQVLMALDAYPFSKRYGWVNDRYGVSWQLTLSDA